MSSLSQNIPGKAPSPPAPLAMTLFTETLAPKASTPESGEPQSSPCFFRHAQYEIQCSDENRMPFRACLLQKRMTKNRELVRQCNPSSVNSSEPDQLFHGHIPSHSLPFVTDLNQNPGNKSQESSLVGERPGEPESSFGSLRAAAKTSSPNSTVPFTN